MIILLVACGVIFYKIGYKKGYEETLDDCLQVAISKLKKGDLDDC